MATIPSLSNARINLVAIREKEKSHLQSLFSNIEGEKCLVLDPHLSKPLGLITEGVSLLKECGVSTFLLLNSGLGDLEQPNVVFMVQPTVESIRLASKHIHRLREEESPVKMFLVFFPRITRFAKELLRDEQLIQDITILESYADIYPLDDDLLSLEISTSFSDLYLRKDYSSLQQMANSLFEMQKLYGVIPDITAVGEHSQAVVDMLLQLRERKEMKEVELPPEIDKLVVLDRAVDFPSCFVIPLTYEGLLDEVMHVECGSVTEVGEGEKSTVVRLNNTDLLFRDLRDCNIARAITTLQTRAVEMKQESETRPMDRNSSISEIMEFKHKLPALIEKKKLLASHLRLIDRVNVVTSSAAFHARWNMEHLVLSGGGSPQEILAIGDEGGSAENVLRLLVLFSLVNAGVKGKLLNEARKDVVQLFGFPRLPLLLNLERTGLLVAKEGPGNFATLRNRMRLLADGVDGMDMTDMNYVTSGYAPLTGRIVQAALTRNSLSNEIVKLLPVPVKTYQQAICCPAEESGMKKKVALVVFLGGVTYTEIAAVRQLKHIEECGYEIILLTTNILNGKTIFEELTPPLPEIPVAPTSA